MKIRIIFLIDADYSQNSSFKKSIFLSKSVNLIYTLEFYRHYVHLYMGQYLQVTFESIVWKSLLNYI
jgi:hypothetical protein